MGRPILSEPSGASRRRRFAVRSGVAAVLAGTVVTGLLTAAGSASAQPRPPQLSGGPRTTYVSDGQITPSCLTTTTGFCTESGSADVAAGQSGGQDVPAAPGSDGPGYLRLSTPASTDKATILGYEFIGRKLSEIDDLRYSTYITNGTNPDGLAPALRIEIDPNEPGVDSNYTSLVWEPFYTAPAPGPVRTREWQTWRPSNSPGGWWATPGNKPNPYFTNYTTSFRELKRALPDAVVLRVGINQGSGSGSAGMVAAADRLRINQLTYDFEEPRAGSNARAARPDLTATLSLPAEVPSALPPGWEEVAGPGEFVATLTTSNSGRADARGVTTRLELPAGLSVTSVNGAAWTGPLVFEEGELSGLESARRLIVLKVDQPTRRRTLPLTATTRPVAFDQNPADNIAWAVTTTRR